MKCFLIDKHEFDVVNIAFFIDTAVLVNICVSNPDETIVSGFQTVVKKPSAIFIFVSIKERDFEDKSVGGIVDVSCRTLCFKVDFHIIDNDINALALSVSVIDILNALVVMGEVGVHDIGVDNGFLFGVGGSQRFVVTHKFLSHLFDLFKMKVVVHFLGFGHVAIGILAFSFL